MAFKRIILLLFVIWMAAMSLPGTANAWGDGSYFFYRYVPLQPVVQRVYVSQPLQVVSRTTVITRTVPVVDYYPQQPLPQQPRLVHHRDFWSRLRHGWTKSYKSHHISWARGLIAGGVVAGGFYLIKKSPTMQRHPLVRHIAQGVLIGTGIGYTLATKYTIPGIVAGAAAGVGYHYLKNPPKKCD